MIIEEISADFVYHLVDVFVSLMFSCPADCNCGLIVEAAHV